MQNKNFIRVYKLLKSLETFLCGHIKKNFFVLFAIISVKKHLIESETSEIIDLLLNGMKKVEIGGNFFEISENL